LAISYWLLAISYWLTAIGYWLTAIGYQLLAIGYWLSANGYQLLAFGYWLSAFSFSNPKQLGCRFRSDPGDLFFREVENFGYLFCHINQVATFVAFSPQRNRSQVG
jgi:hypothetical protein